MEGLAGSGSGIKIGIIEDVSRNHIEAFTEFLRNRQPPRLLSECTAGDAVEFFRPLPSDKIEALVSSLRAASVSKIDGNHKDSPFESPVIRAFLKELLNETREKENGEKNINYKKNLLEQCLTASDVRNHFFIGANKDVEKYFPLAAVLGGTERILRLEDADEEGKPWMFKYSYFWQSYVLTEGWSSYVKEKQLGAGDFVFFQRHLTDRSRLFIGCRRREGGKSPRNDALVSSRNAVLNPTSPATSAKTLELREKLKEFETPLQLELPEHSIPVVDDPVSVIYCGEYQDSEERYFISYIFNDLCLHGFTPLRYDLTRSIVTGNPKMLYRSRVGIIIFSMNYARSRGCLDGFVAIMDHLKANNLVIIPVFFKVSLLDVRGQSGSYEKVFTRLKNSVQASQILKWRAAMLELCSINRYQYMKGDEVMLAKNIVKDVCLVLNSETHRNLEGMRLQLKNILSLLSCSQSSAPHIVGLWGMAGIGKTTISREIFRRQAESHDVCYFLPDFHLLCQTKGLSHLRDDFFSKISGEEKVFIDPCDTKLSVTRERFLGKKLLIVLDGVSNARDAEFLVGGFGWFSGGHTIILTSRNRQVLVQCNAKEIYEIQKLSEPESLRLCCQFATEQNWNGKMSLVSELVNYASGIPLALRVLGSSVQKQCINDEKQHLRRLRQHPPIEIQDAFRRSFDGLDDNERNTFLDLACFFRGENKDHVVNILDGCGFLTDLGIYGLIDESLISLVDNRIEMPNIFQDMGRFVVCQESNEKGKRSRLWDPNDIVDVLTNNSGSEAIEGIFLDASGLTFELDPTVFERIYRLRFLKLHYPTSKTFCKVCIPQGLYSLPDELRLLHWERYPLGSLPRNFSPKNLVELNMPYSNLTKLWKGTKNLENLKRIILSHSQQLTKFPRLSKARNLEHIDLEGCTSLVKVNSSILHHHKLTFLSLKDCLHLRVMPTTVYLESLEVLNLSGCSELEDFQGFSPNLKELYLAGTAITEMPASFGDLTRLVTLDLENCNRLQQLPPEISNLKAVVTLSAKRPASSMDLSSVEDTAPPYKRYRLKRVIESVILSLRKRKREKSVSTAKNKDRNCDFGVSDAKQKSILETNEKLEDPDLSEEALVELLQNLEDMDITFQALQETDIGRHVNRVRKHPSNNVRRLAKQLVKKWKETVDEWVKLNQPGDVDPPSLIADEDSPLQKALNNGNRQQVPDFGYSPVPQNGYSGSSKSSSITPERKPRPVAAAAAPPPPRRESPSPAKASRPSPSQQINQREKEHKEVDFDTARKRLLQNYRQAENAKKQRTIQVMDIHEIPKPKKGGFFPRKGGGSSQGGGRHW
uniref:Putative WRKY transcription factor 19 n=2 Tax=Noccaea caerulescens TaxID=107243 RepID=A0A1J3HY47_NOCCA